ncbi:mandelate racemase/muconate lactonizing enzyme family protein [Roseovarius sp. ZX-A-9]|uniref:mandelate racemase/muconate lactonizing enzyme family protein n=1 Tax=Roseovarius sp. ZX-A-9 TaxID=3014783 RepID=UPI00232C63CF|nr:mandelate racemase/muconate lactonizing enzyme family protein [Roseovarius sp. ZX-A-9]
MKLVDLETFVVGNPPPHFGGRYFILVKLTTDCGIVGYGECYAATFGPHVITHMVDDVFARYFENSDPHHVERMWRRTHGSGFAHRPDVSMMGVFSGLEMACWDIIGKAANQPIYELLGGRVHERLRSYTYIYPDAADAKPPAGQRARAYTDPHVAAERAAEYVAQGFTAVKFDPVGPYSAFDGRQPDLPSLERSEQFCRLIREAVGTKADLLFGTHGQYTVSGAKRVARMLERYDPLWFEEPTPPDMPERMAEVAAFTSVPVATGERLCTKFEFSRVLACKAASILQMNLGRVGGILEAKKIAAMAETHYAQIAPHLYCGPLVGAANVQIATCSPNFLVLESIEDWGGFHADILKQKMPFEDGHVIPPTAPGLGVELNEELARNTPYTGMQLHLEMAADPA